MKPINRKLNFIYYLFDLLTKCLNKKVNLRMNLKSRSIIVFESHLIGDITLSLQLCLYLKKILPNSNIIFLTRPYAKAIMDELKVNNIDFIEFTPPWLSLTSIFNIKKILYLIESLKKVRDLRAEIFIENRGDIRNIIFGHLCNTNHLIGYNFTAGKNFLTTIIPDNGIRKHLNIYNFQIAKIFNKKLTYENYLKINKNNKIGIKDTSILGVHFGASQNIRLLTNNQMNKILKNLIKKDFIKKIIIFDDGEYLKNIELTFLKKNKIELFKSNFEGFIAKLRTVNALLCLDSGPSHLCSILNINSIVISGPSSINHTHPTYSSKIISPKEGICQECELKKCKNIKFKECYDSSIGRLIDSKIFG